MQRQVEIKKAIKEKLSQWNNIDFEDIVLERMTGITNQTYKVSVKSHGQISPIIYRKFGESTQNIFLQRQSEIYVYLHVAAEGSGPRIYYYDANIRMQQYFESTVLPSRLMLASPYLEEVAFTLSKFHQLSPPSERIVRKSLIKRVILDGREGILSAIHKKMKRDIYSASEKELIEVFKKWVSVQELNFIQEVTKQHETKGLVFSHNDLLANNVLISKANNNTIFIDYEYASYNYPIFDIANYICESQFDYDVPHPPYFKVSPIKVEDHHRQVRFIEAYVVGKSISLQEFRQNFQCLRKQQRYQEEIKHLVQLVPFGRMLCQLVWGWWAILVSKNPQITFDYLAYSKRRYDEYQRLKKEVCP